MSRRVRRRWCSSWPIVLFGCACLVLTSGCMRHSHVTLTAPPSSAPPEAREAAYAELMPTRDTRVRVRFRWDDGADASTTLEEGPLVLANGTRVEAAIDLLPVLEPTDPVADLVRESHRHHRRANGFGLASLSSITLSLLTLGARLVGPIRWDVQRPIFLGLLTSGAILSIVALVFRRRERRTTWRAFRNYNAALQRYLQLGDDLTFEPVLR